jgi:hypothetical protein
MDTERGLIGLVIEEETGGPSPVPLGSVTVVANLGGRTAARPASELKSGLEELPVNSVAEACRKFNVTVEGDYLNERGEKVAARILVSDESTFCPDGLTRGDDRLFAYHVAASICDQVATTPGAELSDDDVAFLQETADVLAKSVEGEPS